MRDDKILNDSKITVLTATLITTLMLFSSGCTSIGTSFFVDDPPYQGTKFNIIFIEDYLSGGQVTPDDWGLGNFMLTIVDMPFSFMFDTVCLPFDLIEMSKYPKYHGRVLHGTTGEAMSGVVVMVATHIIKSESSLTRKQWREQLRKLHVDGVHGKVHYRKDNQDYVCVATRTNKKGEFVFKLSRNQINYFDGIVALKEGYKDAWQPCRWEGGFLKSDGYQDVEIPTLYLIPGAD